MRSIATVRHALLSSILIQRRSDSPEALKNRGGQNILTNIRCSRPLSWYEMGGLDGHSIVTSERAILELHSHSQSPIRAGRVGGAMTQDSYVQSACRCANFFWGIGAINFASSWMMISIALSMRHSSRRRIIASHTIRDLQLSSGVFISDRHYTPHYRETSVPCHSPVE
jgi:hypothetical protein